MDISLWIPVTIIIICVLLNMQVWASIAFGIAVWFLFLCPGIEPVTMMQRMFAPLESNSYLAIPFFITAGVFMNYSGISSRLLALAEGLVGHFTGGLAHVNILLSTMMGGCSGSSSADAALDCKILVPEMIKRGYDEDFCAAVTIGSSMITPIIPPGMGMIMYAYVTGCSVGQLFSAGYLPGVLCCVFFMVYAYFESKRRGFEPSRKKVASFKELSKLTLAAFSALLLPFGIILALRFGVFTATEAGAFSAVYALLVGVFIYKEIKLEHIGPMLKESVMSTALVMLIVCASNTLNYYFTWERIPYALATFITNMELSKWVFMLVTIVLLLIIGMFMEGSAPLLILAPLMAPIAQGFGINPIHFGIVFCFGVAIGNMTPPFGVVLYQVGGIMGIPIGRLSKACVPFILIMIGILLILAFVPSATMFIPNLIY